MNQGTIVAGKKDYLYKDSPERSPKEAEADT